ncbi:hypothetical protein [Sphingomonas solaris]|uniref:Glycosyltransferase RgtA/B/C/D-like domain-containing protein n=1 Tax=Alterirhizorhabdus solaris TaxID=2529389 RepID=A0A558R8G0_9SPHN|nr:hypothetical protein [Sphingomonas solaris]TVV75646.1 hypothetical protein FOY91_06525 [Sphingomonas solaris]
MLSPAPPAAPSPVDPPGWWSDRRYLLLLVALSAVPLLWPSLPPLTDALGHLARYHVEMAIDTSPWLHRYYAFHWALLGNLGVDLLVIPLSALVGVQLAVKLIAIAIPTLTAAGLLLVAREAHGGRVPPTAAFALPLAYGFPFQFGFLNHTLSMALALLAFALWLRLGRAGRYRLRAGLFLAIAPLIWLAHVFGWGVLGLLCLAAELARDRQGGGSRWHALWRAPIAVLPLAPPLILMALWRSGAVAGMTGDWFNFTAKLAYFAASLRDRWFAFDVGSVLLLTGLILAALFRRGGLRFQHMLALAALILFIAYLLLPRILLGSAYADMRLIPYVLAIAVIAIRPREDARRIAPVLAVAALAFFGVRTAATTVNFIGYDRAYSRQLAALDVVPPGSRILVLVSLQCQGSWVTTRMDHLGSQAIVRRDAFVNGQWVMPGAQLLQVTYKAAGRFATDPSQLLRPLACRGHGEPIFEDTLKNFPRAAFDYFWLIDMPPERWPHEPDLIPVWHGARGVLYRVRHDPAQPGLRASRM